MGISGTFGTALYADLAEAAGIDTTTIDDILNAERALYLPSGLAILVSVIQERDEELLPYHTNKHKQALKLTDGK